ncbi:MAG: PliI family lysozyme inhibitor of I-type lysozyme [Cyanobacteriota bacterium]|nr:PliI family lysozyme inhibitor of I-type lysozyme [Cyanobacteriota bacterium]
MKRLPLLPLLSLLLSSALGAAAWAVPYRATLRQQDVIFEINATDEGSIQLLQVRAKTGRRGYQPLKQELIGQVVEAKALDLNADGQVELVVVVRSVGSGSYGGVQAWSAGKGRVLEPITLPELSGPLLEGYMGHDDFTLSEAGLVRTFPLYRPGDSQARPSGGRRQIVYAMDKGDGGWVFKPLRSALLPAP